MTDLQTIILESAGGVATISLNRPESFNALNGQMALELRRTLEELGADDSTRAVVLTGEGRAFCSGQDLKDVEVGSDPSAFVREVLDERYGPLIRAMRELPKPLIGAINGVAAGAGMSLALATDIRVMSDRAAFMCAFSRVGLVPDAGGNYFLTQLVGLPRALEMAWTARRVGAEESLQLGLVNRVVPEADLAAATRDLAESLARGPALAIALTKQAMVRATSATLDQVLQFEADLQARCVATPDFREGVAAFIEKREARFAGTPAPASSA